MRKKKRQFSRCTLALLLCLCILFSLGSPFSYAAETRGDGEDREETAAPLSEGDVTITTTLNGIGFAGVEYNLLQGVSVSPETDSNGVPIQIRIKSITSTDAGYTWDGETTTLTPPAAGVVYTVTYEAYSAADGGQEETVWATKDFILTIRGDSEIGAVLNGDYAYISEAGLLADATTLSGYAVRTGTAPWDEESEKGTPGNDTTDLDNTVRSFDIISYTAYFMSKVRPDSPYTAYETGTLHFEFVLPGTAEEARFETGSMGWLEAKRDVQYEITEETYGGQTYQVLRGSYLWEPSEGNPAAIGESYQELSLVVRALALKNGDTLQPEFTFWLEGNDVPETGLVTGSGHSCSVHGDTEYKTITGPEVQVTSAPRYNVQLKTNDTWSYLSTFDFSTGNDLALNRGAGTYYGRANVIGVTLQIKGKSAQHGLRGCELPDDSGISFDIVLSSSYRGTDGGEYGVSDTYMPLVWSLEGNSDAATQQDERSLGPQTRCAAWLAPYNKDKGTAYSSCKDGGTWSGVQNGTTVHITVTDYEVDLNQLPYTDAGISNLRTTYYNPDTITNYWDVQNACFSAGELWLVQPFYTEKGEYIVDTYGTGSFTTTVTDGNLRMTGVSGQELQIVSDNANQMEKTDDRSTLSMALERPGNINVYVAYSEYGKESFRLSPLTAGCNDNGHDWSLSGGKVTISQEFIHDTAEGRNTGVAYDVLTKFDDVFFEIDHNQPICGSKSYFNILYGAKPDKSGWNHQGLDPGDDGYDLEMMQATADDLVFFSSLEELEAQGYTCVAVLNEIRGRVEASRLDYYWGVNGTVKADAPVGCVYMVTHAARAWNKGNVEELAAAYCEKEVSDLTDEDYSRYSEEAFPSRADKGRMSYAEDYPESFYTRDYDTVDGLRTYQKSSYDENGYAGGSSGSWYGDSCLVLEYATRITKTTSQISSTRPKEAYDLDTSQRIADYELHPYAERVLGEAATAGAEIVTDVYIEDTLPRGLSYIPNSSYWGGTYIQNGEGKQGTIEGGIPLEPDVTVNADGTTTLRWTLEQVTVTGEERTDWDKIYYSCDIGTPGNEETDVQNQDQLLNTAIIWSSKEQKRDFTASNGNLADDSILVSKNNAVSLSKTADQVVVDVGDEMPFTLNIGNNATNPLQVIALDSLPYAGDGAGSKFDGDCQVNELTVLTPELLAGNGGTFQLYYTTDETQRGKGSIDYDTNSFAETAVWTELTVDTSTGKVTLPDVDFAPVAIAAVGTLPAQQTLKLHLSCYLPEGKPGDYIANRLTRGDLESFGRSYIVSRTLEGLVWLDDDYNGLQGSGEDRVDGVTVTLMKLKDYGDASDIDDYEPYQVNGQDAAVTTGQQMDLSSGTVTAHSGGRYRFTNLPAGTFGVLFSDGSFELGGYMASPKDMGTDDTLDSDGQPSYDGNDRLTRAFIPDILMPVKEQITTMHYTSRYHDLGLYLPVEFSFTKVKAEDISEGLKGAEFSLYELSCTETGHDHDALVDAENPGGCWAVRGTDTSDPEAAFDGLIPGEYRLVETKAPNGRVLPVGQWRVTVGADRQITITALGDTLPPAFAVDDESGGWLLPNMKPAHIPSSGGSGIRLFAACGAALMAGGLAVGFASHRRSRRRQRGHSA